MRSNNSFAANMKEAMKVQLAELEIMRRKTRWTVIKALLPYVLCVIAALVFVVYKGSQIIMDTYAYDKDRNLLAAGLGFLIFLVFIAGWYLNRRKLKVLRQYFDHSDYAINYKKSMVGSIIPLLQEKMTYNAQFGIPETAFRQSGFPLFNSVTNYHSSDMITGEIGKATFSFAEVWAQELVQDQDGEHLNDLFRGMFFIADFHKKTHWNTIVYPEAMKYFSSLLLGKWSDEKEFSSKNYRRIKLEDPEFERYFEVYGTDQTESRYVLSPALMARIVDFKKQTKKNIQLSFKGSKVYMALHYSPMKNLFQPPLWHSVYRFDGLTDYLQQIKAMLDILKQLNLNSDRI